MPETTKEEVLQKLEALKNFIEHRIPEIYQDLDSEAKGVSEYTAQLQVYVKNVKWFVDHLALDTEQELYTGHLALLNDLLIQAEGLPRALVQEASPLMEAFKDTAAELKAQTALARAQAEKQVVTPPLTPELSGTEDDELVVAPITTGSYSETSHNARLEEFKNDMSKQLSALEKEIQTIEKALANVKDTRLSLIPEKEREEMHQMSAELLKKLEEIKEKMQKLKKISDAKDIINELLNAFHAFHEQCTQHHRVLERSDTFTVFEPTKQATRKAFKSKHELKLSFIEWETEQTDEKKAAREEKTQQLRDFANQIKTPISEASELSAAIIALNQQLKESRAELAKFSLEARWEPYRLVERIQEELDALTKAYAEGDSEAGYTHATELGELIARTKAQGKTFLEPLAAKADAFFHKVDAYSKAQEKNEFSTQIKHEQRLRTANQKIIDDTDRLIKKLIKHEAPSDLIKQAQFFRNAAIEWQQARVNATPQQRLESNKTFMWAHERFNAMVNNAHAQEYIHRYGWIKSAINGITESMNYFLELCGVGPFELPFQRQKRAIQHIGEHVENLEQEDDISTPGNTTASVDQELQRFRVFIDERMQQLNQVIIDARVTQSSNVTDSKVAKADARAEEIKARDELHKLQLIDHELYQLEQTPSSNSDDFRRASALFAYRYLSERPHPEALKNRMVSLLKAIDQYSENTEHPTRLLDGYRLDRVMENLVLKTEREIERLGGKWYLLDSSKERDTQLILQLQALNRQARVFLTANEYAKKHGGLWIPKPGSFAFAAFINFRQQVERLQKNVNCPEALKDDLKQFSKYANSTDTQHVIDPGHEFRLPKPNYPPPRPSQVSEADVDTAEPINVSRSPVTNLDELRQSTTEASEKQYTERLKQDLTVLKEQADVIHQRMSALAETSFTLLPAVEREAMRDASEEYAIEIGALLLQEPLTSVSVTDIDEAQQNFLHACRKYPRVLERIDAFTLRSPTRTAIEKTINVVSNLDDFFVEYQTGETEYGKALRKHNDWLLLEHLNVISEKDASDSIEDFSIAVRNLNEQLKRQRAVVQKAPLSERLRQYHLVESAQNLLDSCVEAYAKKQPEAVYQYTNQLAELLARARRGIRTEADEALVGQLTEHTHDFFDTLDALTANTSIPTHIKQNTYLRATVQDIVMNIEQLKARFKLLELKSNITSRVSTFEAAVKDWQQEHAQAITLKDKNAANQKLIAAYDEFNHFMQNAEVQKRIDGDSIAKSCLRGLRYAINCFRSLIGLKPLQTESRVILKDIKERVQGLKQADVRQDIETTTSSPDEFKLLEQFFKQEIKGLHAIIEDAEHTLEIEQNSSSIRNKARTAKAAAEMRLTRLQGLQTLFEEVSKANTPETLRTAGSQLAYHYFYTEALPVEGLDEHMQSCFEAIDKKSSAQAYPTDILAARRLDESLTEMLRQVKQAQGKLQPKALKASAYSQPAQLNGGMLILIAFGKLLQSNLRESRAKHDASWMQLPSHAMQRQMDIVAKYDKQLAPIIEEVQSNLSLETIDRSSGIKTQVQSGRPDRDTNIGDSIHLDNR